MAKQTGLGDNFYLDGYDLSGDILSIQSIISRRALLDDTGINADAVERLPGLGDGEMNATNWFNPSLVLPAGAHTVLKNVLGGRHALYYRGTLLGNPVAALIGAQANYNLQRVANGALSATFQVLESGGMLVEWGISLTAGKHASAGAENLAGAGDHSFPQGSAGKLSAYLQIFDIAGGAGNDVTVKLQQSDYNTAIVEDDDAVLLVTNLLNNHTFAPTGAGFSAAEPRRVEITIVDTTPSIVAGHVRIIGADSNGEALQEDVSIASGAGVHKTTHFFASVTSVVTLNDVTVLGGAGDETIKVGVEAAVISYADITAGSFQNVDIADAPYKEHLDIAGPIKRYIRAVVGTISGFTTADFAVAVKRY